ncbi:recombinase family protein [Streptomyces yaizuensis]|uniref:Recombinase family protein n=1 Tax=Streptomyces yaizuensis TaxID=2989713 RepID=A0ABQ5PA47_9ACTN|nr:recombinase family protein [Streptomyces sp. YSPA8]GLF99365.1 recombinase family protein [Streptomyces sp. YSPA8]
MGMTSTDAPVTPYDGCGKCLIGLRRLSRVKGATSSPQRQQALILDAAEAVGGHIIAWADDWEVSGATDPRTRPGFGPWLRDEKGPYNGIVGSAVDRIGRNVVDVLSTAYANHSAGRILVTADHNGVWDLTDSNQENELTLKAMGAQMEHRSIRERNRQETHRARAAGQIANRPSYGYRNVRPAPTQKVTHRELETHSAEVLRDAARRILLDETGTTTPYTEAARLTLAEELSPMDWLAVEYGREPKGSAWGGKALREMLLSEAALGYLMHKGRPVLDKNGKPYRVGPPLWDRATHLALKAKLNPAPGKVSRPRAPMQKTRLGGGLATCGNCGSNIYRNGTTGTNKAPAYRCTAKSRGIPGAQHCGRKRRELTMPDVVAAPIIARAELDAIVEGWFLETFGSLMLMRSVYDPGTGHAAEIADLEAARARLREDRQTGIYDDPADAAWFRDRYAEIGREITELKKLPDRPAGWTTVPTGKTVADEWHATNTEAAKREMLEAHGVKVVLHPAGHGERVVITTTLAHYPGAEAAPLAGDQTHPTMRDGRGNRLNQPAFYAAA